jgi:hypothetical protein
METLQDSLVATRRKCASRKCTSQDRTSQEQAAFTPSAAGTFLQTIGGAASALRNGHHMIRTAPASVQAA